MQVKVTDKDGYSATYKSMREAKLAAKYDYVGEVTLFYNDTKSSIGVTWVKYNPRRTKC